MAKFLFCLPRFHTNAVPWVRILRSANHEVEIHVVDQGPTENHSELRPQLFAPSPISRWMMERYDNGVGNSLYSAPPFKTYWRAMSAYAPDVVVVRGFTRHFSRLAAVCALLQGRRLVIYDQEDAIVPRLTGTWLRRTAFRLIGVPHMTTRLPDSNATGNSTAIPIPFASPVSVAHNADEKVSANWPPRMLMVAKYRPRKNHFRLLEALAKIADSHPFTMTFCGEEATAADVQFRLSLEELARRSGLEKVVRFVRNVEHSQMADLYRTHDVFILPSLDEPAAVSPIEAAWLGCAVLVSKDSGTRGYLPDGSEYEFDPSSAEDIARAITSVIASPAALRHAREECVLTIARRSSDALVLERLEQIGRREPL